MLCPADHSTLLSSTHLLIPVLSLIINMSVTTEKHLHLIPHLPALKRNDVNTIAGGGSDMQKHGTHLR